jgi:ABC-2 type transport system permease protein
MKFLQRIAAVVRKEIQLVRRDPRMLFLTLGAPVIQLTILGYAATLDIRGIPVGIVDPDPSPDSRLLGDRICAREVFSCPTKQREKLYYPSPSHLLDALQEGRITAGIVFPSRFRGGRTEKNEVIQLLVDGTDANTAQIVVAEISEALLKETPYLVPFEIRIRYNPEMKSRRFMVVGVFVMVLLISTTILTAMSVVKEKELGTIEILLVSPLKPYEILIGKLLPFVALGLLQFTVVLLAMRLIFGVRSAGSLFQLYLSSGIFILTTLGFGLLLSVLVRTQVQAMSLAFFFLLPMIILSGFLHPIDNMPLLLRELSRFDPIRYFLEIVRGIVIKGADLWELKREILILFSFGMAFITFGILRFRRTLG